MTELHRLGAAEAVALQSSGAVSSVDLVTASLSRIAERDPLISAWAHLDPERALAEAHVADAAREAGRQLGPLHGVPIGIKDIIDTADFPTEHGTALFRGRRPTVDAEVVRRLRVAGAVILGKTVTTELAFYGPGPTRNPADPERTPGGSSSGSAAAVADHHVPLALGSQTAGSILRPASYCGVIGFKPSFGAIPLDGVLAQSPPLDTLGGYARSVEDMALLFSVLSGSEQIGVCAKTNHDLRLAFVRTPSWSTGDAEMRDAFDGLARRHTDVITPVDLPEAFDVLAALQRDVQFHDIARNYGPIVDRNPELVSPKLKETIATGRSVELSTYHEALARREPLYAAVADILGRYDAILTPASQGVAPLGLGATGSPMFNFLWTYLGMPAVSVPLLSVGSLPLGVQLVGRRGQDATLLATAGRVLAELG